MEIEEIAKCDCASCSAFSPAIDCVVGALHCDTGAACAQAGTCRAVRAAVETLQRMGYTYHGAQIWNPTVPVGQRPPRLLPPSPTPTSKGGE